MQIVLKALVVLIVASFTLYLERLSYNGFCFSQLRFVPNAEKLGFAISKHNGLKAGASNYSHTSSCCYVERRELVYSDASELSRYFFGTYTAVVVHGAAYLVSPCADALFDWEADPYPAESG